jgi:hypothetical protein
MAGYKTSDSILPFVNSVKNVYGNDGVDLIVLYKDIPDNVLQDVRKCLPNVKLESYEPLFDRFKIDRNQSVYNIKYIIIYLYIKHILKEKYNYILLSDINDVYIQDDIFIKPGLNDINFFAEKLSLRECYCNLNWYKSCYNQQTIEQNILKKVVNNGVILAKQNSILRYLKVFINELTKKIIESGISQADQAVLTHCVHNYFNEWGDVTVHNMPNKFCVHLSQDNDLGLLSSVTKITNNKIEYLGLYPCIVHQYNRSNILKNFVNKTI